MKIVILTDSSDRHFYFCNRIMEECDSVVGVFLGAKQIHKSFLLKIKQIISRKIFIRSVLNKLINVIFSKYGKKFNEEKLWEEKLFFAGSKDKFYLNISNEILCENIDSNLVSINNKVYIDKIQALKPDVIVVMGTCLLGREIINISKYIINMHTGLSPYYRGGYTNLWPILYDEYGFFGVTIHTMTTGIDSGEIVYTARPDVSLGDSYGSINSKAVILGTDLMIKTISHISANDMTTIKQWLHGKLFHGFHFNNYYAYSYLKRKNIYVSNYCKLDKENKLHKLSLVSNGIIYDS
jgi:methionyl-tRNA formyltransferase